LLLSCFLSFQKEMFAARPGGRRGDSGQEVSGTRPGCYLCKVLCRIDGVFMRAASPRLTPVFLYYFVLVIAKLSMCSRFRAAGNPSGKPRRKSSAKLRRIFRTGKFFRNFFSNRRTGTRPRALPPRGEVRGLRRGARFVSESGCKGTHFPHTLQIFTRLFLRKFTKKRQDLL